MWPLGAICHGQHTARNYRPKKQVASGAVRLQLAPCERKCEANKGKSVGHVSSELAQLRSFRGAVQNWAENRRLPLVRANLAKGPQLSIP
jgi:hypothetical protein